MRKMFGFPHRPEAASASRKRTRATGRAHFRQQRGRYQDEDDQNLRGGRCQPCRHSWWRRGACRLRIQGAGSVRILSNDFEALRVVNDVAIGCATADVKVSANATAEHKNIQGLALTVKPAEYTVAVVANNSIVPLLNDGLIRPLDDLVAKYGASLQPNQLIKIDGKIMAIAFMGNGQHLFYRKDILEKAGVAVPTSYEEMLAAAKAIKDAGLMEYPLAASDKPGWDLAAEFVNMYLGTGASSLPPPLPNWPSTMTTVARFWKPCAR